MNLGELNASSTEQITKWNCFAMKLWAHCQRCLVCSECLIWENACVQREIQFPRWGLESLHHATATWLCQTLDLSPGEQRFQAHISKVLAPSPGPRQAQWCLHPFALVNWKEYMHHSKLTLTGTLTLNRRYPWKLGTGFSLLTPCLAWAMRKQQLRDQLHAQIK